LASRAGYRTRLLDMSRRYVKPCGEVIPAAAMSLVEKMDIPRPEVVERIDTFEFYGDTGRLLRRYTSGRPLWLSIEKTEWVEALREAAGGVERRVASPERLAGRGRLVVDARGPFGAQGLRVVVWRAYARTRDYSGHALTVVTRNPFGLAWAFGHGDFANVGGGFIGVRNPEPLTRKLLAKHGITSLREGPTFNFSF
jgi:hypothetical protein